MTILNEYEHMVGGDGDGAFVFFIIGLAVMLIGLVVFMVSFETLIESAGLVCALIGLITVFISIGIASSSDDTPHKYIDALISDDASFLEIYGKYHIIDRRGDIYTLEVYPE